MPPSPSVATDRPSNEEIIVRDYDHTKVVILNRPRQLNALSAWMVGHLEELYKRWENDDDVSLIIIKGSGRAFCAGGDVARTYHFGIEGQYKLAKEFFHTEYNLNYMLGTYTKPHVAILDGIVMGGGAGISIHGPLRIATENTVFSMPETSLGLHPDVGASYFLSRLPGYLGEYAGLTGARLDGADLVAMGLATHFVPAKLLPELERALQGLNTGDIESVSDIIDEFSIKVNPKEKSPLHGLDIINKCFSKPTVEAIIVALKQENNEDDGWCNMTLENLKKASPLSLKITLRSIRNGRHQTLRECLMQEYRLSVQCVNRKLSNDFYEGVRAILVDKDRKAKWNPATLELVRPELVDYYFSPLDEDEELKLPDRHRIQGRSKVYARL